MIVKDDAPVIRRCLTFVRPIIDYWIVVDTGSTDGTQAIVRATTAAVLDLTRRYHHGGRRRGRPLYCIRAARGG